MKISAVVNTFNEEKNIVRCLDSVRQFVDEVVVTDMYSTDNTVMLAKKSGAKVFYHENTGYVEPARNFALAKAGGDWIFLIDADEVLPETLGEKLRRLAEHADYDFYRLPRKNLIFKKWIQHSGWWPDHQIRFFKKDKVTWGDDIHSIPITEGKGMDLPPEEKNALVHYNYDSVEQFVARLNRYSGIEAEAKIRSGYEFKLKNLLTAPVNEFLARYFAWEGYKDGLHGLVLALLQAFSFLVVELKCWEKSGFTEQGEVEVVPQLFQAVEKSEADFSHWGKQISVENKSAIENVISKIKTKIGGKK